MRYVFDDYELDTRQYELRRRGTPIGIEPRVFDVLTYLIQHRQLVVSKQELFEHLWPDQFVGDAALERCIREARLALGDDGRRQRYIKTLHSRGYRFVGTVEERELSSSGNETAPVAPIPATQALGLPETPSAPEPLSDNQVYPVIKDPDAVPTPGGERKQITVLCCALNDTSALAERVGIEAMYRITQACLSLAKTEAGRFEGTLQPFADNGFIALFGAPLAHEDHAGRSLLAAFSIQRHVRDYLASVNIIDRQDITVRVGIHTGPTVIGHASHDPQQPATITGEAINLAARLQYLADPGAVLATETTLRQAQRHMRIKASGPMSITGQPDSINVYTINELGTRRPSPTDVRPRCHFVGRDRELTTLHELFNQVKEGQGQVVAVVGEAGMGKSRLLYEFHRNLSDNQATYFEGHCLPYGHTMPYLPVRDLIRATCGILDTDSPETITERIITGLQALQINPQQQAPYLLQLLGISSGTQRLAELTPEAIRAQTFTTLQQMSLHASQQRPLIVAVEDLHWIDSTSEAFFAALVESLAGAPILFITTYRPGYRPPWIDKSYMTQIALHRLSPQDSLTVVRTIQPQEALPEPMAQMILARAEGNPFFLEELTCSILEDGNLETDVAIPDTIQGVLMARVDRLPEPTKHVLQMASVIGREVSVRLLERIGENQNELQHHLQVLKHLEFLYERADVEGTVYVFKHVLTQEVVYDSLLSARRRAFHAATGQALETLYTARLEEVYDRLAYHYARTDKTAKAVTYLTHLAEKARRECAHAEAVTALRQSLEHIENLPTEQQDHFLPDVVFRLVDSLHYLGHLAESLTLLLQWQTHLERQQKPTLDGLYHLQAGFIFSMLGEHEPATRHTQRALAIATQIKDGETMGKAHYVLALQGFWSGHAQEGIEHGRQAVALLKRTEKQGPLGMAYFYLGVNYALRGSFTAALATVAEARALGDALADLCLQSYVAWLSGWIQAMRGEWQAGIDMCQQSLEHSPHPLNTALALSSLGYVYLEQGDATRAISQLEQAVQYMHQFQHRPLHGWVTSWLSDAYHQRGDLDKAQALAQQALHISSDVTCRPGIGVAQRILGRIAQTRNILPQAGLYLKDALKTFAAIPSHYECARTHLDLAVHAHADGDRQAATIHLNKAQAFFKTLQVPVFVEHTAQLASKFEVSLE